ncbi:hypothetical protein JCM11641_006116 [Rhodosporidiobolus odoratus]
MTDPPALSEHGISGDVLIHLDHSSLKEIGIQSVGQRLAVLRKVYDMKMSQGIELEEGAWKPPSEEYDLPPQQMASQAEVLGWLSERDHRILSLEHEVHNLHSALISLREEAISLSNAGRAGPSGKPRPNLRSPTSSTFPHPLSNALTLSRSNSNPTRPRNAPPIAALAVPNPHTAASGLPDSPASPTIDSPRLLGGGEYQQQQIVHGGQEGAGSAAANLLHPGEFSINGVATPTTPTAPMLIHPDSHTAAAAVGLGTGQRAHAPLLPASANPLSAMSPPSSGLVNTTTSFAGSTLLPSRPSTATDTHTPSTLSSSTAARTREGSASGNTPENPYRSFRVTLEDPTYKVLPAALKKYKINDDWRLYALFICYGNTERCLAYDEKPLLLFQKLKDSGDSPVFMLRHVKDIKSPIAVAAGKHASRREKRATGVGGGVERSLMGSTRDGTPVLGANGGGASQSQGGQAAQVGANGLAPNARPTRLHHAPVLLPVGKDRDGASGEAEGERKEEKEKTLGWCIAIYPYLAEREDEFDVAVGDTFVILSKTKGWWVVHRDTAPSLSSSTSSDHHSPAARRSAWVPAGCLLETSVPPLSLLSSATSSSSPDMSKSSSSGVPPHEGNAASVPILPSYVVSVSTPGICLMDYSPRGQGELEVRKGQPLRILKRYNHWSYAVKDDGGRGWVPSWFCGRANKGDGTPTTPTIYASQAASQAQSAPSSTLLSSSFGPSSSSALTPSSSDSRPSTAPSTSSGGGPKPLLASLAVPHRVNGRGPKSAGAVVEGAGGTEAGGAADGEEA